MGCGCSQAALTLWMHPDSACGIAGSCGQDSEPNSPHRLRRKTSLKSGAFVEVKNQARTC